MLYNIIDSAIEAVQLGNRDVTETIDNVCEMIQPKLTRMLNISMLNVCSLHQNWTYLIVLNLYNLMLLTIL